MLVRDVAKLEKFFKSLQMEVFNPNHVVYPLKAYSLKDEINMLGKDLDALENITDENSAKFLKIAEYLDVMFVEPHYKKITKK